MKTKHSPAARKKRKKVLDAAKGFWGDRSKQHRRAEESVRRALAYAYRDRRVKKREFRSLWITRINAAVKERGMSYRGFIHRLKEKNILLSRDVLAQIAADESQAFDKLIEFIKN